MLYSSWNYEILHWVGTTSCKINSTHPILLFYCVVVHVSKFLEDSFCNVYVLQTKPWFAVFDAKLFCTRLKCVLPSIQSGRIWWLIVGVAQAELAGKHLSSLNLPINSIVWSTKPRATQTGQIISKYFKSKCFMIVSLFKNII